MFSLLSKEELSKLTNILNLHSGLNLWRYVSLFDAGKLLLVNFHVQLTQFTGIRSNVCATHDKPRKKTVFVIYFV